MDREKGKESELERAVRFASAYEQLVEETAAKISCEKERLNRLQLDFRRRLNQLIEFRLMADELRARGSK